MYIVTDIVKRSKEPYTDDKYTFAQVDDASITFYQPTTMAGDIYVSDDAVNKRGVRYSYGNFVAAELLD